MAATSPRAQSQIMTWPCAVPRASKFPDFACFLGVLLGGKMTCEDAGQMSTSAEVVLCVRVPSKQAKVSIGFM